MKKWFKIVVLPTEDKVIEGSLISRSIDNELAIVNCLTLDDKNAERDEHNNNYLYVLSDDEIKEGDWIYNKSRMFGKKIYKCQRVSESNDGFPYKVSIKGDEAMYLNSRTFKVIATNDPKLIITIGKDYNAYNKELPQIPQLLVEYYAKHQTEYVELAYDCINKLRLQDNEVVWIEPTVPVESKITYTKEAVEGFAFHTAQNCQGMNDLEIEQWIKENL